MSETAKTTEKETLLFHHTNEETAYFVEDYPYGFTKRTHIRYWVETHPKFGDRFCSQTMNPDKGKWNKPKKGTYCRVIVMVRNEENGYISHIALGNETNEKIDAFVARVGENNLSDFQKAQAANMKKFNDYYAQKTRQREQELASGPNGPTGHGDVCHSDADPGL